jgi:hypothetical protein
MRYLIGSELGWVAVPFIFLVGVAYIWVVDRMLGAKAGVRPQEEAPSATKAA